jgi:hypothetical protein
MCEDLISVEFKGGDTAIGRYAFPPNTPISADNYYSGSDHLKNAYATGGAGIYTRPNTTSTIWTKS